MSAQVTLVRMEPLVMTRSTATHANAQQAMKVSTARQTPMNVPAILAKMVQRAMNMLMVIPAHAHPAMQVSCE